MSDRRPAPSFRPNLKLSHFIYKGPERRDYEALIPEMRERIEGKKAGKS